MLVGKARPDLRLLRQNDLFLLVNHVLKEQQQNRDSDADIHPGIARKNVLEHLTDKRQDDIGQKHHPLHAAGLLPVLNDDGRHQNAAGRGNQRRNPVKRTPLINIVRVKGVIDSGKLGHGDQHKAQRRQDADAYEPSPARHVRLQVEPLKQPDCHEHCIKKHQEKNHIIDACIDHPHDDDIHGISTAAIDIKQIFANKHDAAGNIERQHHRLPKAQVVLTHRIHNRAERAKYRLEYQK